MSTIYPSDIAVTTEPLDADRISNAIQPFASEVDGMLGEQNWDEDGFTTLSSDVETDAVFRLYVNVGTVNWTAINAATGEPSAGPGDAFTVPSTLDWSPVHTATLQTCRGGTYRIVWSFQLDAGAVSNVATYWAELQGCCFAFRIDGAIHAESMQGGTERSNDPTGDAVGWDIGAYTFMLSVELSPGTHTIEAVAKPARTAADSANFSSTSFFEIFNRLFYIREAV